MNGDALTHLKELPDESVDMVMTSPPYWALRDYGVEGQLGLEPTFDLYINHLCDIFGEVKRVLKKTGSCWVNLGDTYASTGKNDTRFGDEGNFTKISHKTLSSCGRGRIQENYPIKSLCLIPFRFAIEMVSRKWILRNDVVWYKRNAMPTSVKDRLGNRWEHLFFFVKNKKYYFDLDTIRKPYSYSSLERFKRGLTDSSAFNYRVREARKGTLRAKFGEMYKASPEEIEKYGSPRAGSWRKFEEREFDGRWGNDGKGMAMPKKWNNPKGGNPGDHWDITTKGHSFAHFAVYPEELCEMPIKAGCPVGGIVLDPFFGSGTTGLVALKQGKNFIGIELNPDYIEIAMRRLKPFLEQKEITYFTLNMQNDKTNNKEKE